MSSNNSLNVSTCNVAVFLNKTKKKSFAAQSCEWLHNVNSEALVAHTPTLQLNGFLAHARTPVMQFYDFLLQFKQHMRCVLYDTSKIYTRAFHIKSILPHFIVRWFKISINAGFFAVHAASHPHTLFDRIENLLILFWYFVHRVEDGVECM